MSSVDAAAYGMRASPQRTQRSERESRPNQDRSLALFSDIFFGRNNATVGESAAAILDGATHELLSKPDYRIVVDGHADAAEAPGIALRRAEVERAYLVHARGLAPERVIVRRFDARCPRSNRIENRRVELFLLPPTIPITAIRKECATAPLHSEEAIPLQPLTPRAEVATPAGGAQLVAQIGHAAQIRTVAFSPDGRRALTGSDDATASLWDAATSTKLQEFAGHSAAINSVAFSPDSSTVATASLDGTVTLRRTDTGTALRRLTGHSGQVNTVAFSSDGRFIATGGDDQITRLWEAASGAVVRSLNTGAAIASLAFSPNGDRLLAGSISGELILWNLSDGTEARRWRAHAQSLVSAAFSPDGRSILTAGDEHIVRLWDASAGTEIWSRTSDPDQILTATISPNNRWTALGVIGAVYLLDATNGRQLRRLGPLSSSAEAVAFSPDARQVLVGSGDASALLLDATTGRETRRFHGSGEAVTVAEMPTANDLLLGLAGGTVRLWSVVTGRERRRFSLRPNRVFAIELSPNGRYIRATAEYPAGPYQTDWDDSGVIPAIWEIATGREIHFPLQSVHAYDYRAEAIFEGRRFYLTGTDEFTQEAEAVPVFLRSARTGRAARRFRGLSAALSPDERYVAVGLPGGVVSLYDTQTGRALRRFADGRAGINQVGFSPDGRFLWAIDNDEVVRLWDASTGRMLWQFEPEGRHVRSLNFSADNRLVVVESARTHTATVAVLDTATGRELWRFTEEQHGETVRFSPDGRLALRIVDYPMYSSVSARVVEAATGRELWTTEDFRVRFSPDGRFVMSELLSGGVRLREAATGHELWRFARGRVRSAMSPDGRLTIVAGDSGGVWFLESATGREVARLVFFRDGSWATLDPPGRFYDTTGSAAPSLRRVLAGRSMPLAELSGRQFAPGLLRRLLHNEGVRQ